MQILPEVHLVAASRGANILGNLIQLLNSNEATDMHGYMKIFKLMIPTKV